ncbi:MAG: hypothetical protein KKI09_12645 [Spirochaetes bacterium]|nr:hypothetical protein [Spirochaetota bacterium]MBU0956270.1 hypothetical protein [Spirochaetota bacterium]
MRKVIFLLVLLVMVAVPLTFATGIGVAAGLNPIGGLPGSNLMLSLKLAQVPFLMGVGFTLGQDVFSFGFTGDYWILNQPLVNFIHYYLGPGFYIGYQNALLVGGRFPFGLNVWPLKNLELFLEVAPTLAIRLSDPIVFPEFGLQGAFGLRFWF